MLNRPCFITAGTACCKWTCFSCIWTTAKIGCCIDWQWWQWTSGRNKTKTFCNVLHSMRALIIIPIMMVCILLINMSVLLVGSCRTLFTCVRHYSKKIYGIWWTSKCILNDNSVPWVLTFLPLPELAGPMCCINVDSIFNKHILFLKIPEPPSPSLQLLLSSPPLLLISCKHVLANLMSANWVTRWFCP